MKKSILKLGKVLTRSEQVKVRGGTGIVRCANSEMGVLYDTKTRAWVASTDGFISFHRVSPSEADSICAEIETGQ